MGTKFKVWCDSGANIHSKIEYKVDLDDIGFTEEEWNEASEEKKDKVMRDISFQQLDWGYKEA